MQSNHGFDGQLSACWNHKMTQTEIEAIKSAGFLVSVIHGRCVLCVETLMYALEMKLDTQSCTDYSHTH